MHRVAHMKVFWQWIWNLFSASSLSANIKEIKYVKLGWIKFFVHFIFDIWYLLCNLHFIWHRNAATRCRQKKKMQVEKMEHKAKELQMQNKHLEVFGFNFYTVFYVISDAKVLILFVCCEYFSTVRSWNLNVWNEVGFSWLMSLIGYIVLTEIQIHWFFMRRAVPHCSLWNPVYVSV